MPKPNFIGIGAQKAATSWLYSTLKKHPQVWMTPSKEIHLFDIPGESSHLKRILTKEKGYKKSIGRFRSTDKSNIRWNIKYLLRKRDFNYYFNLFEPKLGQIAGEITPNYSTIPFSVIKQINKELPELKIIYILRNPVERDWSQICMFAKNVLKVDISSISVEKLLKISRQDHILKHSRYTENLARWQSVFKEDNIFVHFFDVIKDDPKTFLMQLYDFLEIPNISTELISKENSYAQKIPTGLQKQIAINELKNIEIIDAYYGNSITSSWLSQARAFIDA